MKFDWKPNMAQFAARTAQTARMAGQGVAHMARQAWQGAGNVAKFIRANVRPGFTVAFTAIKKAARWVGRGFATAFGWLWRVANNVATAIKQWVAENVPRAARSMARGAKAVVGAGKRWITEDVPKGARRVAKGVKSAAANVGYGFRQGASRVRRKVQPMGKMLKDGAQHPLRTTARVVGRVAGTVAGTVNSVNKGIAGALLETPRRESFKTEAGYRKAVQRTNRRVNALAAAMTSAELLAGYGIIFANAGGSKE